MTQQLDWPRYSRWTLIIAVLAAALLVWLWVTGRGPAAAGGCCAAPAAVAAPAATAATVAHTASWAGSQLTLEGKVVDEATKKALVAGAQAKYGAANVVDKLTIDAGAKGAVMLALVGAAPTDAAKATRGDDAKAFYAALAGMGAVTIDNQLLVATASAAVAPPAAIAAPAVAAVAAPAAAAKDVTCGATIAVAATFATGSAKLTPQARTLLDAVVPCITAPYEVGGHTDSVGNAAANLTLSERRAQAVAKYLASKGVDAKLMTTKGYGDTVAIGDNATAQGKAKNRRIEFKKQ